MQIRNAISHCQNIYFFFQLAMTLHLRTTVSCDVRSFNTFHIRFFFSGYSSWSLELLSYSEVLLLENITSGTVLSTGTHFDLVYVGPCKCSNISVSEELSYDTVFIPILSI